MPPQTREVERRGRPRSSCCPVLTRETRNRLGDRFDGAYRWKAAKLGIDRNWQLEASPPRGIASIDRMHRESENGQGQCRPLSSAQFRCLDIRFPLGRTASRSFSLSLSLSTSLFASGLIKRFLARGAAARVRATKSFTATNDESAKPYKNCRPNAFPDRRGQLRADVFPFPLRERWSSCELCGARLVTIGGIGIITATVAAARGHTKKGPIHRGNRPGYHQRNDGAAATWKGGGKRREAKIPWNFLPRFSLSLPRVASCHVLSSSRFACKNGFRPRLVSRGRRVQAELYRVCLDVITSICVMPGDGKKANHRASDRARRSSLRERLLWSATGCLSILNFLRFVHSLGLGFCTVIVASRPIRRLCKPVFCKEIVRASFASHANRRHDETPGRVKARSRNGVYVTSISADALRIAIILRYPSTFQGETN